VRPHEVVMLEVDVTATARSFDLAGGRGGETDVNGRVPTRMVMFWRRHAGVITSVGSAASLKRTLAVFKFVDSESVRVRR